MTTMRPKARMELDEALKTEYCVEKNLVSRPVIRDYQVLDTTGLNLNISQLRSKTILRAIPALLLEYIHTWFLTPYHNT
jgi:hypothetical protein